jgi:hypothetical protein
MNYIELKSLIKESVQEYLKSIDEAGNRAMLEAKINKIDEEIERRKAKIQQASSMNEISDLIDPSKINEIKKEMKILEKGKEKYIKELDKMNGKKKVIDEKEEKLDEATLSPKEEKMAKKMKPALKQMKKDNGKKEGTKEFYATVRSRTKGK